MLSLVAEAALDDVPTPEVVCVPGGRETPAAIADGRVVDWVRRGRRCWSSNLRCSAQSPAHRARKIRPRAANENASSLFALLYLYFVSWPQHCAPHPLVQHDRADRADKGESTPARKSVKMTIVECDEGPRPAGSSNLSCSRTLYSGLEVDKSLLRRASSMVLRAPLREFGGHLRVEQVGGDAEPCLA